MVNFLIWESIKSNPTLPKSPEDIELHREVLEEKFTFDEMADKIKQIFENRSQNSIESGPVFTLNPFKNMLKISKETVVKKPDTEIELKNIYIEKSPSFTQEEIKEEKKI